MITDHDRLEKGWQMIYEGARAHIDELEARIRELEEQLADSQEKHPL